jgi:hypothetical protein
MAAATLGVVLFGGLSTSCATAAFTDAPDTGTVKVCNPDPIVFCDAGVPNGRNCTVTSADTDPRLKRLTPGTYADKCVVNFLGGHDDQGECILASVCKCEDTAYDAAAPPTFVCSP